MPEIIECESGSYPVVDVDGKPIEVGNPVKYIGTGTKGHVSEIICDSEGAWAVIDTNNLLYKLETLTVLEKLKTKVEIGERKFSTEEIREVLEKAEEEAKDVKFEDSNLESGG
jgi:hypothetical protein